MESVKSAPGAPPPIGPYSAAMRSRGFLFCSGQLGIDPQDGRLVEGIEAQTEQILLNLGAILAHEGVSFSEVVMTTIFLTAISDAAVVNAIYGRAVSPVAPPARQTVAVRELPLGALVEISVIAELHEV